MTGSRSGAQYTIKVGTANTDKDKYDHSDEIENEADQNFNVRDLFLSRSY